MVKQKYLIVAAAVGLAGLGAAGVAAASSGQPASLASEVAQKFHLSQGDVQAVIDQHHSEVQGKREQRYEQRLSNAVTKGKITAAQKGQILAKHQELVNLRQSLKGKSPAERRQALQQERTSLRQWATSNHIPVGLLGLGGHGHGAKSGKGAASKASATNS